MGREIVIIDPADELDTVITKIRQAGKDVLLVVPAKSVALGKSTDNIEDLRKPSSNFHKLRKLANNENIRLAIITGDKFAFREARSLFEMYLGIWDNNVSSLQGIIAKVDEDRKINEAQHQNALEIAQLDWPSNPEEAITRIKLRVPLRLRKPVIIKLEDYVELSLDCFICLKRHRTVFIYEDKTKSFCTPTFYTRHGYNAQILSKSITEAGKLTEIIYHIEYQYLPFIDKRFIQEVSIREDGKSEEMPLWGRSSFELICPQCQESWETGAQSNRFMTAPDICKCGYMYLEEGDDVTLFEKL